MRSLGWWAGTLALLACGGSKGELVDTATVEPTEPDVITEADSLAPPPVSPGFQLAGTEPFWGLRIEPAGLRFTTPMDTSGVVFAATTPILAGDSLRWNSLDASGRELEAVVVPAVCSDGMSDRAWPFRARVTIGRDRYDGCAERRD